MESSAAYSYRKECRGCPLSDKSEHPGCPKSHSDAAKKAREEPDAGCMDVRRPTLPQHAALLVQDARERLQRGDPGDSVRAWLAQQFLEGMRDEVLERRHRLGASPPPRDLPDGSTEVRPVAGKRPQKVDGSGLIEMVAGKAAKGIVFALSRCPTPHVKCDHCRTPRCAREKP